MPEPVLLKLGGSVLTKKGGPGIVRQENLALISREIAGHRRVPLLIVHGAGSCGHPEAHRFRLMEGLTVETLEGVFITHRAVSRLNSIVVTALREQGIEAIGIHPLDSCYAENGRIVSMECRHIREMLCRGIVPVLHGDVVMDGMKGATIVSGRPARVVSWSCTPVWTDRPCHRCAGSPCRGCRDPCTDPADDRPGADRLLPPYRCYRRDGRKDTGVARTGPGRDVFRDLPC